MNDETPAEIAISDEAIQRLLRMAEHYDVTPSAMLEKLILNHTLKPKTSGAVRVGGMTILGPND